MQVMKSARTPSRKQNEIQILKQFYANVYRSHGVGTGFKGEKAWETEMSGQKGFLASFASIRPDDIKGARAPLLGTGGDDQFEAVSKDTSRKPKI